MAEKETKNNPKEILEVTPEVIEKVEKSDTGELVIKKLKGQGGLFRVRRGAVRVIFQKMDNLIVVISIDR